MNNFWEEQNMEKSIAKAHEKMVDKIGLPKWAKIECPFCNEKLSSNSIRSIGICLNARNIGDIALEFCCDKCVKMDTIYFRQAVDNMSDFIDLINPDTERHPENEPIGEEKMYKLQYNNLMEEISSKGD